MAKTDKVDVQPIALYGSKMKPKAYKMPAESIQALKQQKTLLAQLKKQLTMSYNLLESFSVLPQVDGLRYKNTQGNYSLSRRTDSAIRGANAFYYAGKLQRAL